LKSQYFIFLAILTIFVCKTGIAQNCGVERWNIKTLSDADTLKIDFKKIIPSTVQEQTSLARPNDKKTFRLVSETQVYSVDCFIVGFKKEDDGDIHIIIEDEKTDSLMVAEIPSAGCFEVQHTSRYILFKGLDEWFSKNIGHPTSKFVFLEKHIPVTLTGVGFWDFYHGQKGTARNAREIHPVLSMTLKQ